MSSCERDHETQETEKELSKPTTSRIDDKDEYRELSNDWRNRDQMIWATPSILITIGGVLIGVAFAQVPDTKLQIRAIVLFFASLWSFTMILALMKHNFYQRGSTEKLLEIKGGNENFRRISPHDKRNLIEKQSAYRIMLLSCSIVLIVEISLLITTLLQLMRFI